MLDHLDLEFMSCCHIYKIWKFHVRPYFYTDFVLGSSEQVFYYRLYADIWMHIEMIPD